ncbi:SDR family oxidoreductase [Defluviimonas sp. WL0024]|uniref:SDR family oxidoreductase n=1 Tax=Albidovulum salinarum TaxID=2984153 RepID=A0ABT2X1P7_9RHOB|nr:SDR family oxidoreductase [Defluviimonas sp. WL0024]MCU9847860.1 SDR family oxidoreductase [Defluviimonas sp. WL0024]
MSVLVVTGGSRGIGAAVCRGGARRGMAVCVNYVANGECAEAVVDEVRRDGGAAFAQRANVGDPGEVAAMFAAVDERLGPVTALVNNAGIMGSTGRVEDLDVAKTRRIFDVNVLGPFYCAKEAVRRMSTRNGGPGGAIVNISSAAAKHGAPGGYLDYAVTKGAIETFTMGLAKELAGEGIRVNCVRPGFTRTEMNEEYMKDHPGWADEFLTRVPMGRSCSVEEMAEPVLWFLSDHASYVTGAVMDVTGGYTCP